jgi:hypothetical protein
MIKRLPPQAADVANAQDAASDALSAPQDSPWQSVVPPLDHPGSPSAATGEEGIPAYQTPTNDLDAGAPVDGDGVTAIAASVISETSEPTPAFLASLVEPAAESHGASLTDARIGSDDATTALVQEGSVDYQSPNTDLDAAAPVGSGGMVTATISLAPGTFIPGPAMLASFANPAASSLGTSFTAASIGSNGAIGEPVQEGVVGYHTLHAGPDGTAPADGGGMEVAASFAPATSALAPTDLASLVNPPAGSVEASVTDSSIGPDGATAAQVQRALDESGLSVNGSGIRVGVLSDSFNDLGGAAADEADGALPPAADIDVIKDLASGGTDEGRAMMQIIHDIAPGADLAFYTAFDSEQDFANGILALAAAGCKVIVDDVSYFDEPFFQNGVVAQAIQTVEAEGVIYVTAAGNDAENAYQAAWTPISGTFDGKALSDAESFGGSLVQTVTINTEGTGYSVPMLLEWNQAYGQATSDLEILVFNSSGRLVGTATNASDGEPTNPWVDFDFTKSGTYYVAIENLSGPNPGLIKVITEGDGLPATISGANVGSVYGHAMTPGAITAGAVSSADTPALGVNPAVSESFSSSGAGTELLFANNGTALSPPDALSPVAVSGVDDINTTVSDLTDFYGTSAAAASLAGVAALILSANPDLTPAEVEQIMEETALPMANSAVSGAGLVAVDAAVAAAEAAAAPAVAVANVTLSAGDASAAASSLFTASAQNGEAITAYGFMDTGPGYFVLEGTDEPNNQEIDVMAAQLSELTYQSAPGTIDTLQIRAEDATGWSAWISFTVTAPPLVIQTDTGSVGSTSLTEVGNEYFLYNSGGVGPALRYNGADVVAGEFGGWTPIGAVQTASGYDVAWEVPGANEYTVWSTDSNGNFVSYIGVVSGNSTALESFAPIFGQDLNGGGVTGVPTVIQTDTNSFGATSLTEVWYNYFLDNSSGSGPELKYGGADVVAGQWGGWVPIGAVQTASGYDVAWEAPGANEYTVWSTDSNGNFVSYIGVVSENSTALESFAPIFGQDLNGDGVTGTPTVIQTDTGLFGSTSLTQVWYDYFLDNSSGSGPELKYGGADVVVDQFGGWVPIGAVQTASGYDVAWEVPGANEYTVWSTDSNGNFVSYIGVVSGNSYALESLETTFGQDLNGDGTIGLTKTVIQTDGSTSLTEVANEYFLYNSSGVGPALKYEGTDVVAGEFGGWVPIGAVQTASGYDVAWELPGTNEYTVWTTDSNGNELSYIGVVAGNSYALESLEPTFGQDLNDDGVIGPLIAAGATLEIDSSYAGPITFAGSTGTLQLDNPSSFTGTVAGLTGQDTLDLRYINPATVHTPIYSGNSSGGTLTVTDGINTANIALLGNYLASTFVASSDGYGGTAIVDPVLTSSNQQMVLTQPLHT